MSRTRVPGRAGLLAGVGVLLLNVEALPQARPVPRLEPVAETKLLMEGLTLPNFRGLEQALKEQPKSVEEWTFARGQALLIAEAGNLLLLRPPRNEGRDAWQERAQQLRSTATDLARRAAAQDHAGSRTALRRVADVCNRCHENFRVPVRLTPFADPDGRHPPDAPPP